MNLSTKYLGLELKNPLVVGASPLSFSLETAQRLEEAGAAAIVMHSLFEEQLDEKLTPPEEKIPYHFSPEQYIQHIRLLKKELKIPVIASLNSIREGAWVRYSRYMQDAGADAIEINLYFLPRTDNDSSSVVEQRAFQIVRLVRQFVTIPVAVKLSPYVTSLLQFSHRMEEAGASGLILFNRFIQPDIDIVKFKTISRLDLSDSRELLLRLHWLAALHSRTRLSLAASGGIHDHEDLIKSLVSGADVAQVVSAILLKGPDQIKTMLGGLSRWMEKNGFETIGAAREKVAALRQDAEKAAGRDNYIRIIHNWGRDRA
jgi:dihydroorotate dehydrogenase (fumarate)